jgi:APA family basic amino acid/polyamine antiporter
MINTIVSQPLQSLIGFLLIASGAPFYLFFKRRLAA